jgi:protoheme ferro-lyase
MSKELKNMIVVETTKLIQAKLHYIETYIDEPDFVKSAIENIKKYVDSMNEQLKSCDNKNLFEERGF